MTAFTFRQTMQTHMLLWGNGYAEIQRDASNRSVAIWPRNPSRTRPVRFKGKLIYRTTDGMDEQTGTDGLPNASGVERTIQAEDMLHIPGLSMDGRVGQNVIELARQAVGLALATEKYGAKYFGNGARPGGVLEHPGVLEGKAYEHLKTTWIESQEAMHIVLRFSKA
jgi:HK97 family phage portal protein